MNKEKRRRSLNDEKMLDNQGTRSSLYSEVEKIEYYILPNNGAIMFSSLSEIEKDPSFIKGTPIMNYIPCRYHKMKFYKIYNINSRQYSILNISPAKKPKKFHDAEVYTSIDTILGFYSYDENAIEKEMCFNCMIKIILMKRSAYTLLKIPLALLYSTKYNIHDYCNERSIQLIKYIMIDDSWKEKILFVLLCNNRMGQLKIPKRVFFQYIITEIISGICTPLKQYSLKQYFLG